MSDDFLENAEQSVPSSVSNTWDWSKGISSSLYDSAASGFGWLKGL